MIMLEVFPAFRANQSTLGSDMLSLMLHHMRSEAYGLRRELQCAVDTLRPGTEELVGLLGGIDERIKVLRSFVDDHHSSASYCDLSQPLPEQSEPPQRIAGPEAATYDTQDVDSGNTSKVIPPAICLSIY